MSAPRSPAALPAKPGLRDALTAFRYRNFSLFWTGALLSNTGTWVQNVTVPFVIYQITGNVAVVGVTSFLQFLPIVLMGPIGGALADRHEYRCRRRVPRGVHDVLDLRVRDVHLAEGRADRRGRGLRGAVAHRGTRRDRSRLPRRSRRDLTRRSNG